MGIFIDKISAILGSDELFSKCLVSTFILYFFKTAFWPITYLFIVSYAVLFLLLISKLKWQFRLYGYFHDYYLPLVLVGIMILVFIISGDYSNTVVRKDIFLIFILFSLFYVLYWNSRVLRKSIPVKFTLDFIIIITLIICVINLACQIYPPLLHFFSFQRVNISEGATIANDYNFFCLFILLGLLSLNFRDKNYSFHSRYRSYFIYSANFVFVINIVLSGSRRGITILLTIVLIYISTILYKQYKKESLPVFFKKAGRLFVKAFILTTLIFLIFLTVPKYKIRNIINRYSFIFNEKTILGIEKYAWENSKLLPKNKNVLIDNESFNDFPSFWESIYSNDTELSIIDTEYGIAAKILRNEGDSGGFALHFVGPKIIYYANHTYIISFKLKPLSGEFDSFNVGWWVNDGHKGYGSTISLKKELIPIANGWYECKARYTFIDNHVGIMGFINSVQDNSWFLIADFKLVDQDFNPLFPRYLFEMEKKLNIQSGLDSINHPWKTINLINNGDFTHDMAFWNWNSGSAITVDLTTLDGRRCAHIKRGKGNGGEWSLYYIGRDYEVFANNEYQISFKVKPVNSVSIPFNVGYWVDERAGYLIALKLNIDTLQDGWLDIKANYTFRESHKNLIFPVNSQLDNSEFYITDISLVNLTRLQYQTSPYISSSDKSEKNNRFSERTERWQFAHELWKSKYLFWNKVFGHGFDYLEWYGEKFLGNSKKYDWPHNPFISIVLYSGIIGLLLYVLLLFKVTMLYIRYRKLYRIAFVGFLITFFFSFFSAGSPFDPPIMGFFMLLPFLIHSIHKNDFLPKREILTDAKNSNNRDK